VGIYSASPTFSADRGLFRSDCGYNYEDKETGVPATLNEQVKVRTIFKANNTSETLSIGSRIRLEG
jgi:hypothetical protein